MALIEMDFASGGGMPSNLSASDGVVDPVVEGQLFKIELGFTPKFFIVYDQASSTISAAYVYDAVNHSGKYAQLRNNTGGHLFTNNIATSKANVSATERLYFDGTYAWIYTGTTAPEKIAWFAMAVDS